MTPDEWRRIKGIAADALDAPLAARSGYVDAQCGDDEALRREVLSLLASAQAAAHLYENPVVTTGFAGALFADAAAPPAMIGRRVGAYRLVSELGHGGMGTAYLAERADEAFEKRVAVKLINRGLDNAAILDRFRHERQILADLEHPNIGRLLDGGTTEDGLPFFVMEYVDGQPIDVYCDTHTLPIAERLRLFQSVCAAVHHAHQHRVVHRDLKPSNILVTAGGTTKLLDFGIAKVVEEGPALDPADPTVLGRAMTPQYASPEQMRGEPVGPPSDVYSLGVLLYQLLTGRPPYSLRGRSAADAERIVLSEPPPAPSAVVDDSTAAVRGDQVAGLRAQLAGDLDLIVLKALRKRPERRYASALDLSADIQRYLDRTAVAARREPLLDRLRAVVDRRPAAAVAVAAGAVIVLIGVLAVAVMRRQPIAPAGIESVAVLPLVNSTGDPELEYLSDGITEDLIRRLSRVGRLRVIARDSVFRYKGRTMDPAVLGRELGVQAVFTGRVARRGSNLSLGAELVDARDRAHLWGERYEREIGDLQLAQIELAQRIADSLRLQLSREEQTRFTRNEGRDPATYELYLKGRYFWNRRTAEGLSRSIGFFREAVARDPSFALAYAGLADAHGLLTEYHAAHARATYAEAKRAATAALAIDDRLAEAHTSRAYISQFYEWDWPAAEEGFKRAIALNPTYATAHQWYAEYLSAMGRQAEALTAIRRALAFDPVSLIINSVEAHILYMGRQYARAIEQCRKVIEMDPNFPEAYEYLKRAYDQTGEFAAAIEVRQKRRQLLGLDARMTPALQAAAAAKSGREYWRRRIEQELVEARSEGLQPFEYAELLAQAGDTTRALEWLDKACAESDFMMMYARVAPNLDPLRNDSRFKSLLQRSCGTTAAGQPQ